MPHDPDNDLNSGNDLDSGLKIPPGTVCLEDYMRHAKAVLPHDIHEYFASGCADDVTLGRNRSAFDQIELLPRILQDCTQGSTRLNMLGEEFRHPIMLAPVAHQRLVHPQGEIATAEAAAYMQTGMVASTLSSVSMEQIAARLPSNKWFQVYFHQSRDFTLELAQRAETAGYSALLVTVDAPVNGARNRIQRSGFTLPEALNPANMINQPTLKAVTLEPDQSVIFQGLMTEAPTWKDIEWLRANTSLPIFLKGILHPSDALRSMEAGLQGAVVSNHGGRCLDTTPASIAMLPGIRDCVGSEFLLLLDGGVRRGTDVFKALALGADAVLIGRPQVMALAVAGSLGVAHMIKLLREELEMSMALAGCPTLASITRSSLISSSWA